MKVVLISGHDADSDRKTGFHFWAEILAGRNVKVDFITAGSSPITLLKKSGKQLKPPFNQWVTLARNIRKFTWLPLFHPMSFKSALLDKLSWPLFKLYPYLLPSKIINEIRDADVFIVEVGAGVMLVPRLSKIFPKAKFIYSSSDRPGVVKFHSIISHAEKQALPYFDMVRLNAAIMADDFPPETPTQYIPQAIDKSLFDQKHPNPYKKPRNAISIGDMLFDAATVEQLAAHYPDWTFHLFGKGARLARKLPNVIEYGELPFTELVPYLQHADIGLAPYAPAPDAGYLSQSSLKLVQYTYCRLPIVAPDFATIGREHAVGYSHGSQGKTAIEAFGEAISYDRQSIDRSGVLSWEEMMDRMIQGKSNKNARAKPANDSRRSA